MSNTALATRIAMVAAALVGGAVSVCLTALLAMGAADLLAVAVEPGKSGDSAATTFDQPVDQRPTPRSVTWDRLEVGDCYDDDSVPDFLVGVETDPATIGAPPLPGTAPPRSGREAEDPRRGVPR